MAAVSCLPSMSFSTSSLSLPRTPFLGSKNKLTTTKNKSFISSASLAKKCTTINMISKFSNGRYIREDYLVKKVSAKELQELVRSERSVPLVVDFYATWCGPCIIMAQVLEMLAVEYGDNALIVKVDTDDEYEFSRDMQVRGLPTLYFISPDSSKDAIRTEGLIPKEMIKNIIDSEM